MLEKAKLELRKLLIKMRYYFSSLNALQARKDPAATATTLNHAGTSHPAIFALQPKTNLRTCMSVMIINIVQVT